ncbi:MAG: hypothetical protein KKB59_18210, partial [Spirochaetes bacterium]|nr:hypothetical protein [Spirochaetota bacterium]
GNLEEMGVKRDCTYDNAVSCYGYSKLILENGEQDIEARKQAVECCAPSLLKRLDGIYSAEEPPELLVALGNTAMAVLLPGERRGIRTIGGEIHDGPYGPTCPVLHPASVMYESSMYPQFLEQLNEVRLFFSEEPAEVDVEVVEEPERWEEIAGELSKYELLSVDLETTSFSAYDSGVDYLLNGKPYTRGQIICILLSGDGEKSYVLPRRLFTQPVPYVTLKLLLERSDILCHNGVFDVPFLLELGIKAKLKHDSLLRSYAIDEHPFHGLKRLTRMEFGVEDWSAALDEYLPHMGRMSVSYANVPEKVLFPYGGKDTAFTHRLDKKLTERMSSDEKRLYENLLIPCANMFIDTKHRGLLIDLARLMELKREWEQREYELYKDLRKQFKVYGPYQHIRIKQNLLRLGIEKWMVEEYKTDMHAFNVYKDIFEENDNEEGLYFSELIGEWRDIDKAKNTHLLDVAQSVSAKDLCVHPDIRLHATVTGRLVIGHPTLLNFPIHTRLAPLLREVFIPRPGYVWAHYDQKQFEIRVYAAMTDDKQMKQIFRERRDPYDEVGKVIHGDEYVRKTHRGWTKTGVLGRLYGRSVQALAYDIGVELPEAQGWSDTIDSYFSGLPAYRRWIEDEVSAKQELVNPLGRTRRWPIITPSNWHQVKDQAYNFPVQGTANDLNLLGMHQLHEAHRGSDELFALFPFHDAVDFELREDKVDELDKEIREVLAAVPTSVLGVSDIEFRTDRKIGRNWSEASVEEE